MIKIFPDVPDRVPCWSQDDLGGPSGSCPQCFWSFETIWLIYENLKKKPQVVCTFSQAVNVRGHMQAHIIHSRQNLMYTESFRMFFEDLADKCGFKENVIDKNVMNRQNLYEDFTYFF